MKYMRRHALSFVLGASLMATMATLWAQEAAVWERGLTMIRGNLYASAGYVYSGGGLVRDYRTNTSISTAGAATYTAAQVLSGLITRTVGVGGNVTDVLPTATVLAAGMAGEVTGTSFSFLLDMGATPNAAVTLNGASTGVTYSDGCTVALTTNGTMHVLIVWTSATAYRAVCNQGGI